MEKKVVGLLIILILFSPHFSRAATSPSLTVSIVANNIDRGLAGKELEKVFRQRDISYEFVNAGQYAALSSDLIILGGPQTSEGVGPIVKTLLPDYLKEKLITQPDAQVAYETVDSKGRHIWIFAGNDRDDTKAASVANYDNDAFNNTEETALWGNPNWFEIPPQYKGFITDMFNNNPEWARYVVSNSLCFEDNNLNDLEKRYLGKKATDKELLEYYLSELNAKYPDISKELKKLPEYKNGKMTAEAAEDIAYLFLQATNPEVAEAGQLMLNGGTPDPKDFGYAVPTWNTEFWGLYQLAEDNEFKQNDITALSIAMVDGLYRTMGDDEVQRQVRIDDNAMLDYAREVSDWLKANDFSWDLENYPLEAKVMWAWRGNDSPTHGWYGLSHQAPTDFRKVKLPLKGYMWGTVGVDTLKQAREILKKNGWVNKDIDKTVQEVRDLFWFNYWLKKTPNYWNYQGSFDKKIEINGETWPARNINNANFELKYFLQNGKGIRVCEDSATLSDALLKSSGIPTRLFAVYWPGWGGGTGGDTQLLYFANSSIWKIYDPRFVEQGESYDLVRFDKYDLYIFKPPVIQPKYFDKLNTSDAAVLGPIKSGEVNNAYFPIFNLTPQQLQKTLFNGFKLYQIPF